MKITSVVSGFRSVIRRKQVGSVHCRSHPQLARKLSAVDLVGIGNSSFSNFQVILIMVLINDSLGLRIINM